MLHWALLSSVYKTEIKAQEPSGFAEVFLLRATCKRMEWTVWIHYLSHSCQYVQEQTAAISSAQDKLLYMDTAPRPHLEEARLYPGAVAPSNSPSNSPV